MLAAIKQSIYPIIWVLVFALCYAIIGTLFKRYIEKKFK